MTALCPSQIHSPCPSELGWISIAERLTDRDRQHAKSHTTPAAHVSFANVIISTQSLETQKLRKTLPKTKTNLTEIV